jgi:hypothetical protein
VRRVNSLGVELVDIMPLSWHSKEPSEALDYSINWARDLGNDTITTSTWTVPPGLTENGTSNTETTTAIWLSGGVLSKTYIITNEVVTAGGRTYRENIYLTIARK